MKKKSKSTAAMPRRKDAINPEILITRDELQTLYDKEGELEILKQKVDKSKPILETIYSKIKRKELENKLALEKANKKAGLKTTLLKEYKELY